MKNIKRIKLYAAGLLLTMSSFAINPTEAKAMTSAGTIHLSNLVEDDGKWIDSITGEAHETDYMKLLIEENDLEYLDKVDLDDYKFSSIELYNVCLEDGKKIDLDNKKDCIEIHDSVVNMSTIDLSDFDEIRIYNSYNLGKKVSSDKIDYKSFINEEYINTKKYDKVLNKMAKYIKKNSNGTKEDLIRRTTLFVGDLLKYDMKHVGESEKEMMDSIMKKGKGVCAHYALIESKLLRKLGIFSLYVVGYTDAQNICNSCHAWNMVYLDDKWYSIDPTWLDNDEGKEDLYFGNENLSYMADIDNEEFNSCHHSFFENYDKIPKKYLKVK